MTLKSVSGFLLVVVIIFSCSVALEIFVEECLLSCFIRLFKNILLEATHISSYIDRGTVGANYFSLYLMYTVFVIMGTIVCCSFSVVYTVARLSGNFLFRN